jgi:hypothetical protein
VQQDSFATAIVLRRKATDELSELVKCVHYFITWCSKAEDEISNLTHMVMSADGLSPSIFRIELVRQRWEVVQKGYREYKTSVSDLQFLLV